jgi:alkyl hydroperoxide reductase subunit D
MTLEAFKDSLGNFAKDIKLNLGTVLTEDDTTGLSQRQIYGIALASAYSTKNLNVIKALAEDVAGLVSEEEFNAAKAAATIMAMNNVYYRFVHLVSDKEYGKMPAKLRMNIIANPGIAKVDFELYCLAVSAINGCGMCIDAHVREVAKAGISKAAIQAVIRIAAVIHAAAQANVIR